MKTQIEKIPRENITDQLFEILKKKIISKEWPAGTKIPSETELAEQFGVSRMSIRVALQKLNTLGLLEICVGEGTFVKELSFENIFSEISDLIGRDELLEYLAEYRKTIELDCIRLAIRRGGESELRALGDIVREMEQAALAGDFQKYVQADYRFHYHICKMTHNKLYEMSYASIRSLMQRSIEVNVMKGDTDPATALSISYKSHLELFRALERRDEKYCITLIFQIHNNAAD